MFFLCCRNLVWWGALRKQKSESHFPGYVLISVVNNRRLRIEARARMEGLSVGKGDAEPAGQASVSLLSHVLKARSSCG